MLSPKNERKLMNSTAVKTESIMPSQKLWMPSFETLRTHSCTSQDFAWWWEWCQWLQSDFLRGLKTAALSRHLHQIALIKTVQHIAFSKKRKWNKAAVVFGDTFETKQLNKDIHIDEKTGVATRLQSNVRKQAMEWQQKWQLRATTDLLIKKTVLTVKNHEQPMQHNEKKSERQFKCHIPL